MSAAPNFDEDAIVAAVDLVGRAGAKAFELGYLDDDVPVDQARWWAHADYGGDRITVAAAGQCRWTRKGRRWEMGCQNRAQRRRRRR